MILPEIYVWKDESARSPAGQMAMDEAIFRLKIAEEGENAAFLRFYTWSQPAKTIGFFMPWGEIGEDLDEKKTTQSQIRKVGRDVSVEPAGPENCRDHRPASRRSDRAGTDFSDDPAQRDASPHPETQVASGSSRTNRVSSSNQPCCFVRRLTGGGIVEHGEDVTFSLVAGKNHPLSSKSTVDRYRIIHEALRDALVVTGEWPEAMLAPIADVVDSSELSCFSKPVGWDVMESASVSAVKIAGGAQRSSRGAWLHQGTVRMRREISMCAEWTDLFASKLGGVSEWTGDSEIENAAADLERTRYGTRKWNERR